MNICRNVARISIGAIVALILCCVQFYGVDAAERLIIGKRFEGGVEFTARPNIVIAQWKLTIDTITTEQTLLYRGAREDSKICVESRIVERNSRTKVEKQVKLDSIRLVLDCEGDMIYKVEQLTFAMRLTDGVLKYTVLKDWDTVYIDPDTALQRCRHGHEWISRKISNCPLCGTTLSRKD
ncbi:MAG: hypothetical protein WBP29_04765 [Candidatus Zixiibacteriota bacterium]